VQRALEEELRVLRARLEAEGRLEGELERVREELRRESAKKGDLEREVRELRERMQEMGRELERRGWEISQAANKTAEEYSGKYVKEISELEESHRAALKRLSN
jgi:chromosome segregation ATPase